MYRTWISILTQLDFCYMFEYVCAKKGIDLQLECNAKLDEKGIDAMVKDKGFQITKTSQRKEARSGSKKETIITIPYAVYNIDEIKRKINSERVKKENKIKYQKMLEAYNKYFIQLKNGFVVFGESYIEKIVNHINDIEKIKYVVNKIWKGLSGEF